MKRMKAVFWSLKNGFMHAPVLFILHVIIQVIRSTLVVYTSVYLGEIISDVQIILENN